MKTWKNEPMRYTTKQFVNPEELAKYKDFLCDVGEDANFLYGEKYDWWKTRLDQYCKKQRVVICFRDEEPVGLMLSRTYRHFFDPDLTVLKQDLLYATPGTRAAYYLMQEFIDFGKLNANHIITMIGEATNIKRQSLEKLGFKKLEELYRIEV